MPFDSQVTQANPLGSFFSPVKDTGILTFYPSSVDELTTILSES